MERGVTEMSRIMAVRLAMPMALALGLALPAGAQQPADIRTEFACKIDLRSEIAGVPEAFRTVRTTFDTEKLCPGNVASENFKIDCFDVLEGWPAGLNIVDQDFTCFISGTACNVPGTFASTGETLRIQSGTDPATGGPVGFVRMTCHHN